MTYSLKLRRSPREVEGQAGQKEIEDYFTGMVTTPIHDVDLATIKNDVKKKCRMNTNESDLNTRILRMYTGWIFYSNFRRKRLYRPSLSHDEHAKIFLAYPSPRHLVTHYWIWSQSLLALDTDFV